VAWAAGFCLKKVKDSETMKYVKIGETQMPVNFGMGALMEFEKQRGQNVLALLKDGNLSITDTVTVVYVAFLNGCKKDKRQVDFDLEKVADWLDETPGLFDIVMEEVAASMVQKKKEDEPGKK
jgi:hypothetical protein